MARSEGTRDSNTTEIRHKTGTGRSASAAACGSASRTARPAPRAPGAAPGSPAALRSRPPNASETPPGRPRPRDLGRGPFAARGQEIVEQLSGALIALADGRRHRAHHDVVQLLRNPAVPRPRRSDQFAAHQPLDVGGRRRLVRQPARQHLVHRDAQRVDVRGEHRLAVELLGRHVGRAADHRRSVRRRSRGTATCRSRPPSPCRRR